MGPDPALPRGTDRALPKAHKADTEDSLIGYVSVMGHNSNLLLGVNVQTTQTLGSRMS